MSVDEFVERLESNLEKLEKRIYYYYEEPDKSNYTLDEIIDFKQTVKDIKKEINLWVEY